MDYSHVKSNRKLGKHGKLGEWQELRKEGWGGGSGGGQQVVVEGGQGQSFHLVKFYWIGNAISTSQKQASPLCIITFPNFKCSSKLQLLTRNHRIDIE